MSLTITRLISGQANTSASSPVATTAASIASGKDYFLLVTADSVSSLSVTNANDVVWTLVDSVRCQNVYTYFYLYHGVCTGSHASASFNINFTSVGPNDISYFIDELSFPITIRQKQKLSNSTGTSVGVTLSAWNAAGVGYAVGGGYTSPTPTITAKNGWTKIGNTIGGYLRALAETIATQDLTPNVGFSTSGTYGGIIALEITGVPQTVNSNPVTNSQLFYDFFVLTGQQLTITNKTSGYQNNTALSYNTTAIDVTAGKDYLLTIQTARYDAAVTDTVANGNDVTWTLIDSKVIVSAYPHFYSNLYLYHGVCTGSHASASWTVTRSGQSSNQTDLYSIDEISEAVNVRQYQKIEQYVVDPSVTLGDWLDTRSIGFMAAATTRPSLQGYTSVVPMAGWKPISSLSGPASAYYNGYAGLGTAFRWYQDVNSGFTFTGYKAGMISVELSPVQTRINPDLFTNSQAFYGFDISEALLANTFFNSPTFYLCTLSSHVTITVVTTFQCTSIWFTANLSTGLVTLEASTFDNVNGWVTASILGHVTTLPSLFVNNSSFYTGNITTGEAILNPSLVTFNNTFLVFTFYPGGIELTQSDSWVSLSRFYTQTSIIGVSVLYMDFISLDDSVFFEFSILRKTVYEVDTGNYEVSGQDVDLHYYSPIKNFVSADKGEFLLDGCNTDFEHQIEVFFDGTDYAISGSDINWVHGSAITADTGECYFFDNAADLLIERIIEAGKGEWLFSGSIDYVRNKIITGAEGAFDVEGQSADLFYILIPIEAGAGEYSILGWPLESISHRVLKPEKGVFSITGESPDLFTEKSLFTGTGVLSIKSSRQRLIAVRSLSAEAGSFALSNQTAVLKKGLGIGCAKKRLFVTGEGAGLLKTGNLVAGAGQININGGSAIGIYQKGIAPIAGYFTMNGQIAGLNKSMTLTADKGSLSRANYEAKLEVGRLLDANNGNFFLSGLTYTGTLGKEMSLNGVAFNISNIAVSLMSVRSISPINGLFVETGGNIHFNYEKKPTLLSAGQFTFTAQSVQFASSKAINLLPARVTVTGKRSFLLINRGFQVDPIDFTVNGAAALLSSHKISALSASFGLDGCLVTKQHNYSLNPLPATYTLTVGGFSRAYNLECDDQSFTYGGSDSILILSKVILANAGHFIVDGLVATGIYTPEMKLNALGGDFSLGVVEIGFTHTDDLTPRVECKARNLFLTGYDANLTMDKVRGQDAGLYDVVGKPCSFTVTSDRSIYALPKR